MSQEINYQNNPLHGVSLKTLLTELVTYYGFEILFAYLSINCFKSNPSIESSIKFLKKTDWAREKVEAFYLYEFKNLPRASSEQFLLSPRDRIIPKQQTPANPAELSLEDAEHLRKNREKRSAEWEQGKSNHSKKSYGSQREGRSRSQDFNQGKNSPQKASNDPWGNWGKKD